MSSELAKKTTLTVVDYLLNQSLENKQVKGKQIKPGSDKAVTAVVWAQIFVWTLYLCFCYPFNAFDIDYFCCGLCE